MTLLFGCECGLGGGKPIEVTVVDGAVTDATSMAGRSAPTSASATRCPSTSVRLRGSQRERGKLELKYDDHLGYPVALGVDPDLAARDDEIRVAVTKLVPGR